MTATMENIFSDAQVETLDEAGLEVADNSPSFATINIFMVDSFHVEWNEERTELLVTSEACGEEVFADAQKAVDAFTVIEV